MSNRLYNSIRTLWAASVLAVLSLAAHAQPQQYEVLPGPLDDTLFEFAEKARLSINFSGLDASGIPSPGTSGFISKSASLRAILMGTGLSFRFIDDNTVQIFKPEPQDTQATTVPSPMSEKPARAFRPAPIEDLVVTAAKRSTTTFDLPVNVTGVSSLTLEDLNVFSLQSLAPYVAGFTTTNLGPGRNKIFVRGLSDGPYSDRTQALVGVYLDDTPVNLNDTNPDIRLFDAERVELVRGPQGTLYGAGTIGGLYRVISNKPVLDDTAGRVRVTGADTYGGGSSGQLDFMFNAPIVRDKLGFRVSGYVDLRDGYMDDLLRQVENTNDLQVYGFRPSFRWQVAEDWTVDIAATGQIIRYEDSQYFVEELGRNNRANILPEPYEDDFLQVNTTIQGKLGDMRLTSSSSFIARKIENLIDASFGLPFIEDQDDINENTFVRLDVAAYGSLPDFVNFLDSEASLYLTKDDISTFTHETRLESAQGGRLEWVTGLFYLNRKQTMQSVLLLVDEDTTDPSGVTVGAALTERRIERNEDIAVFGELVYNLTDKLSFTGGVRLSHHVLSLDYSSQFSLQELEVTVDNSKSTEKLTPKVALSYKVSSETNLYGQISRGYRVGGLNINTPLDALAAADPDFAFEESGFVEEFQSDDLTNYEIGLKSLWFDRRLALNLSGFYVEWSDIQSDQIGPSGLPFVTNVGNAHALGFEVEFSANPLPGLEIKGTFFWNDAKLDDDNLFLKARQGDRLPAIPERTFSLAALYQFRVAGEWDATLAADYAFTGESALQFDEDTSPIMGGFGILNARIQFSNGDWRFGVFGENLNDTFKDSFAFGNGFTLAAERQITPPRPRTIGLFLEKRF